LRYPSKEIVAIIGLTILGVVFANFGVSERVLYGIVVGIAGIAGFKMGYIKALRGHAEREEFYLTFEYYYRQLLSTICYLAGAFLLAEHLWTHGSSWDWTFPPGHELWGLLAIIAGILIGLRTRRGR